MKNPNLEPLVGARVSIETHEGALQTGKISKINYIQTIVLGEVVSTPKSIEYNNDPSEFADWDRIREIKRLP